MVEAFNFIKNIFDSIGSFVEQIKNILAYEIPSFKIYDYTFDGFTLFEVIFGVGLTAFLVVTLIKWFIS